MGKYKYTIVNWKNTVAWSLTALYKHHDGYRPVRPQNAGYRYSI